MLKFKNGALKDPMIQSGNVAIKSGFNRFNTILKDLPLAGVFAFL